MKRDALAAGDVLGIAEERSVRKFSGRILDSAISCGQ